MLSDLGALYKTDNPPAVGILLKNVATVEILNRLGALGYKVAASTTGPGAVAAGGSGRKIDVKHIGIIFWVIFGE